MYTQFYKLKAKPFQTSSDPAFIWLGEKHKEALATLKYGVLDNKGFMLLTGDVGTGKTTLINTLIKSLSDNILYASVPDPRLELNDFLNYIANAFHLKHEFATKGQFLIHFSEFLYKAYEENKQVLLLIDESQLLTQDLLEEIRLLSNIQRDGNYLLNIFFVGQDEFNEILDRQENRAVAQRLTLNYHLEPLTQLETGRYIRHRLDIAGTREQLFNEDAVREIQAYSGGFPRRINILCDHCLLSGFVKERHTIDADTVRECAHDLKIPEYTPKIRKPPPRPVAPQVEHEEGDKQPEESYTALREQSRQRSRGGAPLSMPVVAMLLFFATLGGLYSLSPATFSAAWDRLQIYLVQLTELPPVDNPPSEQSPPGVVGNSPVAETAVEPSEQAAAPAQEVSVPEAEPPQAMVPANDPDVDLDSGSAGPDKPSTPIITVPAPSGTEPESGATASQPVDSDNAQSLPVATDEGSVTEQTYQDTLPVRDVVQQSEPVSQQGDAQLVDGQDILQPVQPAEAVNRLPDRTVVVRFDPDSSEFYFADLERVDDFVEAVKSRPKTVLLISGHTDSSGSEGYNYRLSLYRANMVKSFFLGKGVKPFQLKVRGFGSSQPLGSNETPEGRRLNRRVEIDIEQ